MVEKTIAPISEKRRILIGTLSFIPPSCTILRDVGKLFFLLILTCLARPAPAAGIREFKELLTVKTFIEVPGANLDFKSVSNDRIVKWKPNVRGNVGVGVSLAGIIGGSVSAKGPLSEEDRIARGDTRYQDWRFFLTYSWIQIQLNYQEYNGFYIENSKEVDPSYENNPNSIQEPAMSARNYSINSTFVWSPQDFSLPAALDQTVRQETSGGSFLLGAAVNHNIFNNDNLLIPATVRPEFGIDQNIMKGAFTTFSVKAGYGYSYIYGDRKWFLSGVLLLGGGWQNSKYADPTQEFTSDRAVGKGDLTISWGYSGDRYFSGLTLLADATTYETRSLLISSNLYLLSLFFGLHL